MKVIKSYGVVEGTKCTCNVTPTFWKITSNFYVHTYGSMDVLR